MPLIRGGLIGSIGGGGGGSGGTQLDLSDGLACYTASFSGITTSSFTHGLGTTDIVVEFKDSAGNLLVPDNWQATNNNTIAVEFPSSQTGDITVIGCIASGVGAITGGVTTIEGLSGIVDLDSPNGSIVITTSGQVINLNAIFTPASGALLEQKCRDIDILSGLIQSGGGGAGGVTSVNGISGVITLASPNNSIGISVSGQTINLSGIFTWASGQLLAQKCEDIDTLSGLITSIVPDAGQTSINGLSGLVEISGINNEVTVSGQTIIVSGFMNAASGAILEQKCEDINTVSGVANSATQKAELQFTSASGLEFVLGHGLQTTAWVATMWRTDGTPEELLIPHNIYPSGVDHAVVVFRSSDAAPSGYTGRVVFVG